MLLYLNWNKYHQFTKYQWYFLCKKEVLSFSTLRAFHLSYLFFIRHLLFSPSPRILFHLMEIIPIFPLCLTEFIGTFCCLLLFLVFSPFFILLKSSYFFFLLIFRKKQHQEEKNCLQTIYFWNCANENVSILHDMQNVKLNNVEIMS